MNKTYNDPAKQLWRVKLREFITKNILPYKNPQTLRVACFPGAEVEGEEGLEIKEIYLPLGIQPQNIIGLERDAACAQRLRTANLGIEVVEQDAKEYFLHENPNPFDIISLDYLGQMTHHNEGRTLESIASRQLLSHHGILATNFFGSREGEPMKDLLVNRILLARDYYNFIDLPDEVQDQVREKAKNEWSLDSLREGITYEINAIFSGGTTNYPISKNFYSQDPRKREIFKQMEELLRGVPDSTWDTRDADTKREVLERWHLEIRSKRIIPLLKKYFSEEEVQSIHCMKLLQSHQGYVPKSIERYAYTSNSGSSMLVDFFAFQPFPKRIVYTAEGVVRYKTGPDGIISVELNPAKMNYDRLQFQTQVIVRYLRDLSDLVHTPRVKLIPEEVKRRAGPLREPSPSEKAEIYSWIRDGGATDAELCATYKITTRQLGSYKAWVTMQEKRAIAAMEELT